MKITESICVGGISVQIYSSPTEIVEKNGQPYDIPWVHLTSLERRGPDDFQTVMWPFCRMDFYRLSIKICLYVADNPFSKCFGALIVDNTFDVPFYVMVSFIMYNVEQLVKELPSFRRHTLQSKSDCEVVLTFFISLVEDRRMSFHTAMTTLLRLLDGEFAFVLVLQTHSHLNQKKIKDTFGFVGRDPFGVRPLFMSEGSLFQSLHHKRQSGHKGETFVTDR